MLWVCSKMYERFVEKALHVVSYAQQEAHRLGLSSVGTGELLIGLMKDSNISSLLLSFGFGIGTIHAILEQAYGEYGKRSDSSELEFTPLAKNVIYKSSWEFACSCGRNYILSCDIFGAILTYDTSLFSDEEMSAHTILHKLGVIDFNPIIEKIRSENTSRGAN